MNVDVALLSLNVVGAQTAQAALFAGILFVFGRRRRQDPLRYWGWSWAALFAYYVLMLSTRFPYSEGVRFGARALGGIASFCGAVWLVQGTLALLGRPAWSGRGGTVLAALLGAGSGLIPLLATSSLHRSAGPWLIRCLVVGAAYVACATLLWKVRARASLGRIVLPAAFMLYGLKLFYYLWLGLVDLGSGLPLRNVSILGISDVSLQAAMGLGTVIWLLEREHEHLKDLDRMKSDLLANVSHELRTPLTAIRGYADFMLDGALGPVSEAQAGALGVVKRSSERLAESIGALLDFSRMEAGRTMLILGPFSLPEVVEQALVPLHSDLERAGLAVELRLDRDLPPVIGDCDKLTQVVENLVVNAMKFTPAGGRIMVTVQRAPAARGEVAEVRVTDTGIGIPAEQLDSVFDRFFQGDASATRRFGGVGLGLAIVKGILDAHGSPIGIESDVGRGTTFRFSLPLHEAATEPHPTDTRPPAPAAEGVGMGEGERPEARATILVVDDEADTVNLLRTALTTVGYRVLAAGDGQQALSALERGHPDLILLDMMMPGLSGFEVLKSLGHDPETARIPVLVLSARGDDLSVRRGLALGARKYIGKPFDVHELISEVRRQLGGGADHKAGPIAP